MFKYVLFFALLAIAYAAPRAAPQYYSSGLYGGYGGYGGVGYNTGYGYGVYGSPYNYGGYGSYY